MIIQVFYMCASDQCLKILLYNKVERKVRLIKYEQWETSGQNRRLRHIISVPPKPKGTFNICWSDSLLLVFWLVYRYICAKVYVKNCFWSCSSPWYNYIWHIECHRFVYLLTKGISSRLFTLDLVR